MKPPQTPECSPAQTFPEVITNRPGLDRIRYRVGDYAGIRRWLFEQLDKSQKLAAWTYRGADDPGIALYEGAALVLDSLTFYQEAYANEAFLRTATWRESVAELVRLLGYRLMPGIGGVGTFAFELDADKPITIPVGVAIQAKLDVKNADFQTSEEVVAYPWLSKLSLERPKAQPAVAVGLTKLVVTDPTLTFQENDRLLIASVNGVEFVVVASVTPWHGRTVLTLKSAISKATGTILLGWKLDKSLAITGSSCPDTTPPSIDYKIEASHQIDVEPQQLDLAIGTYFIIRNADNATVTLARVTDVMQRAVSFGPMSIPSTRTNITTNLESFDRRAIVLDTTSGLPFWIGAPYVAADPPQPTKLAYWGDHALDLKGRRIGIAPADKPSYEAVVLDVQVGPVFATLSLDRTVDYADFEEGNTTAVFGNLVDVTEGKQQTEATLGNGDDRATFQSFKLPKAPLTYLDHPDLTPPNRPEVQIVVNGRIWAFVDVLYGQPADAMVYIIRQDDNGDSWVQFGDGKTGARLPSGVDNVIARYRTGSGAYGAMADGAKPSADRTVREVTAVDLVDVISGGSAPEDMATAKVAAPARVQSLDRIVSITDVEAEALAIGGVAKARAVWTLIDELPVVQVTLLMQEGRTAELAAAQAVLATAAKLRGPQRYPIVVVPGAFEYVYLDLTLSIDPTYDKQPVKDGVTAALAALFAQHSFGDSEYATRIEGVAQNVPGIQWALVNALGSLGTADDPSTLVYPAWPTRAETVPGSLTHVLRLAPNAVNFREAP
ncbi:MAG: hypothetical protein QM831_07550 [Kofleriaceae bacterium]